ncbi:MAG: hypothetical protein GXP31_08355 [Kiritimatiellaeota bacterium]|nr:hypothetical protein [Kiritimatiellota bacterium]
MKTDNSPQGDCPSLADLSAWLDGEHDRSLEQHVSQCGKCGRVAEVYRWIGRAVQEAARPSEGLAERIRRTCRDDASRPNLTLIQGLKIAAAVAVLGGVGFWFAQSTLVQTPQASGTLAMRSSAPARVPPQSSVSSTPTPRPIRASVRGSARDRVRGRVAGASVRMASTRGASPSGMSRRVSNRPPMLMPGHIRQVWVVPELKESSRAFLQNLPPGSRCVAQRIDGGVASFRIVLPDDRLPSLIQALAEKGYALVTPNGPQPETPIGAWRLTRQNVLYDVRFVANP